jgi:hypothetical protein
MGRCLFPKLRADAIACLIAQVIRAHHLQHCPVDHMVMATAQCDGDPLVGLLRTSCTGLSNAFKGRFRAYSAHAGHERLLLNATSSHPDLKIPRRTPCDSDHHPIGEDDHRKRVQKHECDVEPGENWPREIFCTD